MPGTARPTGINGPPRTIHAIVSDIADTWGANTYYLAAPYIDALLKGEVKTVTDTYTTGENTQSGETLVRLLLANASRFKGERARFLKEELRAHLPRRR